ncbi:MAG: hypothetical protein U9Q72_01210 [Patescibacteria group bacterium]|nr:hypothetical protein [Patescibacteria group bacterium]
MPNKKQKQSKQKGLTLIGLLIGGAIIGITFTSGLTLISRNIRFSSVTAHEIAASALAEEGVELIRNIRDTGDNYYIKEDGSSMTGFEKINKNGNYALDYILDTYNEEDILDDKAFGNGNAGLCLDDNLDNFYQSCQLSTGPPNLKFIRKINLNNTDSECGGVLVTVTVYWTEFWEGTNWPSEIGDIGDDLHKVQVEKCMYDWRPR